MGRRPPRGDLQPGFGWNSEFQVVAASLPPSPGAPRRASAPGSQARGVRLGCVFSRSGRTTRPAKLRICSWSRPRAARCRHAPGEGMRARAIGPTGTMDRALDEQRATSARRIYQAEGFKLDRERHHTGKDLVDQFWSKDLQAIPQQTQSTNGGGDEIRDRQPSRQHGRPFVSGTRRALPDHGR
jgi:hypothetical protein